MKSIRRKITLFILIAILVPYILFSMLNYIDVRNSLETNLKNVNSDLTKTVAGEIAQFFNKVFAITSSLSQRSEVVNMKAEDSRLALENAYREYDFFDLLYLTDLKGMQIARSSGMNADRSGRFWFKKSIRTETPFISEGYFSRKENNVIVSVIIPVINSGKMVGVFGTDLIFAEFSKTLDSLSKKGVRMYLVDWNGNVIYDSKVGTLYALNNLSKGERTVLETDKNGDVLLDKEQNQKTKVEIIKVEKGLKDAAAKVLKNESGSIIYKNENGGNKVIVSYTPIEVKNSAQSFGVLFQQDYKETAVYANRVLVDMAITSGLLLIVLIVLSVSISVWISIPIVKITEGVKAIKNGRLEHRIEIKGDDEFSKLGTAVNGMAANLMDSYEQQIRKNRELRGINMELEASNSQLIAAIRSLNESEENLREAFRKTVQGLIAAVEAKDIYTESHSLRVANYSVIIANTMGYELKKQEDLWVAAVLHDIGKIGIPDMILNKKGKLTESEYNEIKQHPVIACKMLAKIDLSIEILEAIRYHHERYDGQGYPDNLIGNDIPEMAAIISVADAFDAITSSRAYRASRTIKEGVDEIVRNVGTQFNVIVVSAFLNVYKENEEILSQIHLSNNIDMPI